MEPPRPLGPIARVLNRWRVRRAWWAVTHLGYVQPPEPRTIGDASQVAGMMAGQLHLTGYTLVFGQGTPWGKKLPNLAHNDALHRFFWLDNLVAVGDAPAQDMALAWVGDWLARFGKGAGPGWRADLTGRRLLSLVNNAGFLESQMSAEQRQIFQRHLATHTIFLSKTAARASVGIHRLEAATGLLCASLALKDMDAFTQQSLNLILSQSRALVDENGALASRNPEELLEVFSLLVWCQQALDYARRNVPDALAVTIARIAPVLRSLRHGDGTLPRFHGGGKGAEFRMDQTLVASGVRATKLMDQPMGYARMTSGSSTLIADAAPPASGRESVQAHASTAAFELTTGRQRLIVNCGSGLNFGDEWRLAGRATPSHSTLGLNGVSSSRFGPKAQGHELFDTPTGVEINKHRAIDGTRLQINHNGYLPSHGLAHARTLDMTLDGKGLYGEDELFAPDGDDVTRFQNACARSDGSLSFSIRFHIHPDVNAALNDSDKVVVLTQANGDTWAFKAGEGVDMMLAPSVYLEQGRIQPLAADQIVLSGEAEEITTRVRWSLVKT